MINLVKYNNRKIYSPDVRRYVNLDEIVNLVKAGEKITIRAHETNAEVTEDVLKQCLIHVKLQTNDLVNLINKGEIVWRK